MQLLQMMKETRQKPGLLGANNAKHLHTDKKKSALFTSEWCEKKIHKNILRALFTKHNTEIKLQESAVILWKSQTHVFRHR